MSLVAWGVQQETTGGRGWPNLGTLGRGPASGAGGQQERGWGAEDNARTVGGFTCGTRGGGGGAEWARRTPISVPRVWVAGGC